MPTISHKISVGELFSMFADAEIDAIGAKNDSRMTYKELTLLMYLLRVIADLSTRFRLSKTVTHEQRIELMELSMKSKLLHIQVQAKVKTIELETVKLPAPRGKITTDNSLALRLKKLGHPATVKGLASAKPKARLLFENSSSHLIRLENAVNPLPRPPKKKVLNSSIAEKLMRLGHPVEMLG